MDTASVTLLMTTYNQERFVAEAFRSLLDQAWDEPLEILVADDASTDATWDIVHEIAVKYEGPFEIVLCRNPTNLGAMANMQQAMAECRGDLLVRVDGDDVQLPDRVRRSVEPMRVHGASLVSSNAEFIDENGVSGGLASPVGLTREIPLEEVARAGWNWTMLGATSSWSRELIEVFGWFNPELLWSGGDHVLPFRAALLGGFHYVGEPLMKWRRHPGQATQAIAREAEGPLAFHNLQQIHNVGPLLQRLRDLGFAHKHAPDAAAVIAPTEKLVVAKLLQTLDAYTRSEAELRHSGMRMTWLAKGD